MWCTFPLLPCCHSTVNCLFDNFLCNKQCENSMLTLLINVFSKKSQTFSVCSVVSVYWQWKMLTFFRLLLHWSFEFFLPCSLWLRIVRYYRYIKICLYLCCHVILGNLQRVVVRLKNNNEYLLINNQHFNQIIQKLDVQFSK